MSRRPDRNPPLDASGPPPPLDGMACPVGVVKLADAIVPLLWTFDAVVRSLGVSRRTLERERSAGRFPRPDLHIGKRPMWRPETIRAWIDEQSREGVRP